MKLVNNEGKIFGKINLLDFLVLLVLLIAAIGLVYKFVFADQSDINPDYSEGYITFKLDELLECEVNEIQVGDTIRVPLIQKFGEIVEISTSPTKQNYLHDDGVIYPVDNPLCTDVYVKVKTDALYQKDGFYYIDRGYKVVSGMSLELSDGVMFCKGSIYKIEKAQ